MTTILPPAADPHADTDLPDSGPGTVCCTGDVTYNAGETIGRCEGANCPGHPRPAFGVFAKDDGTTRERATNLSPASGLTLTQRNTLRIAARKMAIAAADVGTITYRGTARDIQDKLNELDLLVQTTREAIEHYEGAAAILRKAGQ